MKLTKPLLSLLLLTLAVTHSGTGKNTVTASQLPDRPRSVQPAPAVQVTKKTLTNDDVVKMISGGLSEATIIQVIHKGPTDFDTSPDALIKLKENGASPRIIEAMLGPVSSPAGAPAKSTEGAPRKGVFVQSASEWKRIEEVSSV